MQIGYLLDLFYGVHIGLKIAPLYASRIGIKILHFQLQKLNQYSNPVAHQLLKKMMVELVFSLSLNLAFADFKIRKQKSQTIIIKNTI